RRRQEEDQPDERRKSHGAAAPRRGEDDGGDEGEAGEEPWVDRRPRDGDDVERIVAGKGIRPHGEKRVLQLDPRRREKTRNGSCRGGGVVEWNGRTGALMDAEGRDTQSRESDERAGEARVRGQRPPFVPHTVIRPEEDRGEDDPFLREDRAEK